VAPNVWRALDLNKARNRLVVDAVIALSTKPDGFTVAQLATAVQKRSSKDANTYSPHNLPTTEGID
jgi:hypothetical protein